MYWKPTVRTVPWLRIEPELSGTQCQGGTTTIPASYYTHDRYLSLFPPPVSLNFKSHQLTYHLPANLSKWIIFKLLNQSEKVSEKIGLLYKFVMLPFHTHNQRGLMNNQSETMFKTSKGATHHSNLHSWQCAFQINIAWWKTPFRNWHSLSVRLKRWEGYFWRKRDTFYSKEYSEIPGWLKHPISMVSIYRYSLKKKKAYVQNSSWLWFYIARQDMQENMNYTSPDARASEIKKRTYFPIL